MENVVEQKGEKKIFKIVLASILLVLVLSILSFLLIFHIREVEVVGSTRYTDAEIKDMALVGPFATNSVLVTWLDGNQEVTDIPFLNGFKIEQINNRKVRIIVSEKQIIGYIKEENKDFFFDKDGLVVEVLEPKIVNGKQLIEGEAVEEVELIQPEEVADSAPEDATKFHAAVTNVPLIEGLDASNVALNQKLKVRDEGIFNAIWGIARMVEKFDIQPDKIAFDESNQATMYYSGVRVLLGNDSLLEEKISRAAAILPKLAGKSGELHLEDYKEGVDTIVFSGDVPETTKSDEGEDDDEEKDENYEEE